MGKRHRRKFTDEFKVETVKLIRESGRTVGSVARELDLTETAVREWVKKAERSGAADTLSADERTELRRLRKENQELRMEKEIFRQGKSMRFAFIDVEKASYPMRVLCRVLEVSRSGYYTWRFRKPSSRNLEDERLRPKIVEAFKTGRGTYGSPRVRSELVDQGFEIGRKRVARLMRELGLQGVCPRKFRVTTQSDHDHPIAENVLDRDFEATGPNEKWATDITYVYTGEGWLYLAVVMDLFSRRIVGWSTADHLKTELCLDALQMALDHRVGVEGLLHHSDRGVQYASDRYREALAAHGIECSMSRRANRWDNSVAESFFGTIKNELIYRRPWSTREEARGAIGEYIEIFYNRIRRHSTIGDISPAKFEEMAQTKELWAA